MRPLTRRTFVSQMAGTVSAMSSAGALAAGDGRRSDSRPNILLAISDDQSWVHAGAYGCPGIETPAFDRVARDGVLFANGFSAGPMCTVSRACALTGRNIWQNREAGTHWSVFPRDLAVYPELLQQAGYETGCTGKGWGPGEWKPTGWPHNPSGPEFNERKLDPPTTGIKNIDYRANFSDFRHQRDPGKPFCFWYGSSEPHSPVERGSGERFGKSLADVVLPPFMEDTPQNRRSLLDIFVEIEWFDQHLAKMLESLEESGELENTIVVVTGDNGTSISHAKGTLYDYGVHVPLAIMWPQQVRGGRVVEDLVSFIDFAPTFVEAAGLEPHPDFTGRSILPALTSGKSGRVDAARERVLLGHERGSHRLYDHLGYPMRAIRTYEHLYVWNLKPDRWPKGDPAVWLWGPRGSRRKEDYADGLPTGWEHRPEEELFDLAADPGCMTNLAEDPKHSETLVALREQLRQELTQQGDPRMLGYGDIWESYPRFGRMRPEVGGFAERGEYNPKYRVPIPGKDE